MDESLSGQLTIITWKPFIRAANYWDNTVSTPTIKQVPVCACRSPSPLLRACQVEGWVLEGTAMPFYVHRSVFLCVRADISQAGPKQ